MVPSSTLIPSRLRDGRLVVGGDGESKWCAGDDPARIDLTGLPVGVLVVVLLAVEG
jgi:hypothetical protein